MKKKKNAFTLIELLAIIVILAIIAVITVPIILNIIENSRRGAATDSAYGFKDSINKYYVTELANNRQLQLEGPYTVTNGVLNGSGISNKEIPVSGDKPSSGYLNYTNNTLTTGCLVIGDYTVEFNNDGTTSTVKGECTPTIASCPGCKFIYTLGSYAIVGSPAENDYGSFMPTEDDGLTNDYTTLIGEGGHPYFLGLIESTSDSTRIGRAFACGIENGTPFCLEGYDPSKYSDDDNVGILNTIFPECGASASSSDAYCSGSSVGAGANDNGSVYEDGGDGACGVSDDGFVGCGD